MPKPSEFLLDLLKKNSIPGCMILLQENEDGDVKIFQASDGIHKINITLSLATVILDQEKGDDSEWSNAIQGAARAIISVCHLLKDIAEESA